MHCIHKEMNGWMSEKKGEREGVKTEVPFFIFQIARLYLHVLSVKIVEFFLYFFVGLRTVDFLLFDMLTSY